MIPKNSTQLSCHLNPKKCCCTNLIRRILISYHLRARARIAIKKPYLWATNRLAKKVWANDHALLPKIFWQTVLFLDEKILELHPKKRLLFRGLPDTGKK